jgi:Domain of unknown function (DUF4062)
MPRTYNPYRVFVSSTFEDLREHRKHVIGALRLAGMDVEAMEEFSASSRSPSEFCSERMKRCNLCVLLVGFRRGDRPPESNQSFTQNEYQEAIDRGIDVLPFILKDSPEIAASWPSALDERANDEEVDAWRKQLKSRHVVREFGVEPPSINIDSAIAHWVVEIESTRARQFRRNVRRLMLVLLLVAVLGAFYIAYAFRSPDHRSWILSTFLGMHDPSVFNNTSDGRYELARVLDSSASLVRETRLSDEIRGTSKSFDMLVNNAQYIRHAQKENFLDIVRRGAKLRLILWDYSESNRANYDAFCQAIGQNPEETREGTKNVHNELRQWNGLIKSDKAEYPGNFEYRWNKKPLFYTMWVRDWGQDTAIGHLSAHFYRGQEYFPSFRVSMLDGKKLLGNMHDEFELAWRESVKLEGD